MGAEVLVVAVLDTNGDGAQDGTEPDLADVDVQITDSSGSYTVTIPANSMRSMDDIGAGRVAHPHRSDIAALPDPRGIERRGLARHP